MVLLPIGGGTRKQRTWSEALCDTHSRRGGSRVPSKLRGAQAGGENWGGSLQPPMGRRVAGEARVSGWGAEQARWRSDGAAVWTHGTGT